jgi:FkbM family methyltransferase
MMTTIARACKRVSITGLPELLRAASRNISFSQYAEDLFVSRIFQFPRVGRYVDVGAAYPILHSNTFRFYLRGWYGLTIEPNLALVEQHRKVRPNDTCVPVGIGCVPGARQYYQFDPPDYNTFDPLMAGKVRKLGVRPLGQVAIPVRPLSDVLSDHLGTVDLDLMSVDCEGLDLDVLQSNNWSRFRPSLLLVEDHAGTLGNALNSPVALFVAAQGYVLVARLNYTSVFVANEAMNRVVGHTLAAT